MFVELRAIARWFQNGSEQNVGRDLKCILSRLHNSLTLSMSLQTALQELSSFRRNNVRKSQETFKKGVVVLKSGASTKLGEEGGLKTNKILHVTQIVSTRAGWAFLEQLALASLDIGRIDIADVSYYHISDRRWI